MKKTIPVVQNGDTVLRALAKEVPKADIGTKKIQKILAEMTIALESQSDGVAIAAPQIGHGVRIFIVSGKIFEEGYLNDGKEKEPVVPTKQQIKAHAEAIKHLIFINPKITRLSREKKWMPEGCLSVRWLYGKTYRSTKATVEALDEYGKKFTRGASGLLAQIFQHETDHLNGILFIDHAKDVKEEHPEHLK